MPDSRRLKGVGVIEETCQDSRRTRFPLDRQDTVVVKGTTERRVRVTGTAPVTGETKDRWRKKTSGSRKF